MTLHSRIKIIVADITTLEVDCIVNAANETLLGGAGVDYAVHNAAGPELLEECRTLGGCPTGQAKMTRGYKLPARHIIHAVGPIYNGGGYGESDLLTSCYQTSLRLASEAGLRSIAFPCISTGMFSYPDRAACDIAVATVIEWLATNTLPETVVFCCFSEQTADLYRKRLDP